MGLRRVGQGAIVHPAELLRSFICGYSKWDSQRPIRKISATECVAGEVYWNNPENSGRVTFTSENNTGKYSVCFSKRLGHFQTIVREDTDEVVDTLTNTKGKF